MRFVLLTCFLLTSTLLTGVAAAQQAWVEPQPLPQEVAHGARNLTVSAPSELKPFPFRQASADQPLAADSPAIKLAPRGETAKHRLDRPAATSNSGAIGTVIGSLAVVLGLFVVLVWCSKRFAPAGAAPLPKEVVELLGRAPLSGRQSMQLVRIGNKLLLVALSTGGAETLTEITDPVEVEHLAGLCRRGRAESASAAFRNVLGQLATEEAPESSTASARNRSRGAT